MLSLFTIKMRKHLIKGVGRKFSRGVGPTEKRPKLSKKYRKIAKKAEKIAPFSLYLLGLYYV